MISDCIIIIIIKYTGQEASKFPLISHLHFNLLCLVASVAICEELDTPLIIILLLAVKIERLEVSKAYMFKFIRL